MLRLLVVDCPKGTYPLYVGLNKGGTEVAYVDSITHGPYCTARTATPADIDAAFVAQCRADGRAERIRGELESIFVNGATLGRMAMASELRQTLAVLNLSALLESEAGNEEGEPCADS